MYQVTNPATGITESTGYTTDNHALEMALETAYLAQQEWRSLEVQSRAAVLSRCADELHQTKEQMARIIVREMGKPLEQALGEVALCVDILRYYAETGPELLADEATPSSLGEAVLRYEPIGTVLGIMPWNFPCYQILRFAVPNLLLGNAVLIKPAPNCPESAATIVQLFSASGLPAGAFDAVFITHEQVAATIADDRVMGVSITGSERAGRTIAELAGRHLKKCTLELGGSDALLALDAATLAEAARAGVRGRLANAGQVCTSPKRLIVLDEHYDDFVALVEAEIRGVTVGDPILETTNMGPLSSPEAAATVLTQVEDSVQGHGAVLQFGSLQTEGAWLSPILLTDIPPSSPAWQEEIFGPVVMVHRAADEADAIRIANDSPYGLSASVFGADPTQTRRVADQLVVGMVFINSTALSAPELPFGGTKRSGFGKELGVSGLREFANVKLIHTSMRA